MKVRALLVPAATIGPNIAYGLIFLGLIFNITGLTTLGILVFGIAVVFSVLTLPVEIGRRVAPWRCSVRRVSSDPSGSARRAVDADGGGPHLRRGGRHVGADAALLHRHLAQPADRRSAPMTRQRIPDEVLTAAHERARPAPSGTGRRPTVCAPRSRPPAGRSSTAAPTSRCHPATPPDVEEEAPGPLRRVAQRAVAARRAGDRRRRRSSSSPPTGRPISTGRWPASARRARRDVDRHRRGRAIATSRRPRSRRSRSATPTMRGRLDERAARPGRRDEHRYPPGDGAGRHPAGHERRTDRRRRHAARSGPRRPDRRRRGRVGHHVARPAHVRGRAGRRRRRDRGLRPGLPPRRRRRRAARSTSGSASIGTSTSGGASSCATKGRGARRGAPSASPTCPADRHEHRGWTSLPDEERDRQSKRNFYRIIDRFGWRRDLLVSERDGT